MTIDKIFETEQTEFTHEDLDKMGLHLVFNDHPVYVYGIGSDQDLETYTMVMQENKTMTHYKNGGREYA